MIGLAQDRTDGRTHATGQRGWLSRHSFLFGKRGYRRVFFSTLGKGEGEEDIRIVRRTGTIRTWDGAGSEFGRDAHCHRVTAAAAVIIAEQGIFCVVTNQRELFEERPRRVAREQESSPQCNVLYIYMSLGAPMPFSRARMRRRRRRRRYSVPSDCLFAVRTTTLYY